MTSSFEKLSFSRKFTELKVHTRNIKQSNASSMKISIFLCALGMLLVCQETLCIDFPALLEGNCKPEDIGTSMLAGCENIKCEKAADGNISIAGKGCGISRCPDGRKNDGEPDLTKKYPDCCPRLPCVEH